MQHNAWIIDSRVSRDLPDFPESRPAKRMVCRMTGRDALTALFKAADLMNERPCQCLVITDQEQMMEAARLGGFDVSGVTEAFGTI